MGRRTATAFGLALCAAAVSPARGADAADQPGADNATDSSGVVLTGAGSAWQYRLVTAEEAGAWGDDPAEVLGALSVRALGRRWPDRWVAFSPPADLRADDGRRRIIWSKPEAEVLASIPEKLTLDSIPWRRAIVEADEEGRIDLVPAFGPPVERNPAFLFAELEMEEKGEIAVAASADWWMQWWIDGEAVFSLAGGNRGALLERPHVFSVSLDRGRHVLAVRVQSGRGGWAMASEAFSIAPGALDDIRLEARLRFEVADPSQFASLTFKGPGAERYTLNGWPIPVPLRGMRYDRVAGVPPALLDRGENALRQTWAPGPTRTAVVRRASIIYRRDDEGPPLQAEGELIGLKPEATEIESGPILGRVRHDGFTVSCRTNMIAPAYLRVAGRRFASQAALIHRFVVDGLEAGTEYDYAITAGTRDGAEARRKGSVRTLPDNDHLRFIAVGDGRTHPDVWSRVAAACAEADPDLLVYTGDMVAAGRRDEQWQQQLFGPGAELLASAPFYPIVGNHEQGAPLYDEIFMTPGGGRNWAQEINGVLLIGIDGFDDWSEDGPCVRWLEKRLAASDARFIFLFTHYPAWSSSYHGSVQDDGRPKELTSRQSRYVVLPLLEKHNATAMIVGHDHCYERSEPPGGVTCITSAGAGAPLYGKRDDPKQNPHSVVFRKKHHYTLFEVRGDSCTMKAFGLEGGLLDSRSWEGRSSGARR